MTYLEGTRQIKRSGLGRHGPEGTEAHGGGGRSRPAGGGAGQTAREHGWQNADGSRFAKAKGEGKLTDRRKNGQLLF